MELGREIEKDKKRVMFWGWVKFIRTGIKQRPPGS